MAKKKLTSREQFYELKTLVESYPMYKVRGSWSKTSKTKAASIKKKAINLYNKVKKNEEILKYKNWNDLEIAYKYWILRK